MPSQDVASSSTVTFLCCSLRLDFARLRSTLQSTSAALLLRDPVLEAAFRSPAANASFRTLPRQGQCSQPTSSIQLRDFPVARSIAFSRPVPLSGFGPIDDCNPLPPSGPGASSLFRLSLPVRIFAPPDRSAQPFSTESIRCCVQPDFPLLPEIVPFKVADSGSSFQVRYRPPSSLSHEPLGTINRMPVTAF